jgi:uncharacterized coiled-coil DUF342 family protein
MSSRPSGFGEEVRIMDDKAGKQHNTIQKYVSRINNIQKQFGGYKPEYINMYFAAKLESLTRVLIVLTAVLTILTIIQIILLIRVF